MPLIKKNSKHKIAHQILKHQSYKYLKVLIYDIQCTVKKTQQFRNS